MPRNFRKFQCLLLAACLAAGMAGLARAGQVSFSTYYPAPFGIYDRLRLPPRAALAEPCDAGTFYYETGVGLRFCDEATQAWGSLGGGVWTQSGDNIYPSDTATNPNLNVGIGTTAPNNTIQVTGLINFPNTQYGTFLGYQAGNANTGAYNTFVGYQAGISNATGMWNTANGMRALYANTTGDYNTANGGEALRYNTTGRSNTSNGNRALFSNTTGYSNTANGYEALNSNTTGYENTSNGNRALFSNTTGYWNTANGVSALHYNTTGSENTANGYQALYFNTGINNTANGMRALQFNTTGSYNTANGSDALASNTTGVNNTANGYRALYANTTGYKNTADGYNALYSNTTGSYNTAIGFDAQGLATNDTNETVIGARARGNGSNSVTLGDTSVTKTILNGNVGIGTTAPLAKLEVVGGIKLLTESSGSTNGLRIYNTAGTTLYGFLTYDPFGNNFRLQANDPYDTAILNAAGNGITVKDSTGNVGIGTTSPGRTLDVNGKIAVRGGPNYTSSSVIIGDHGSGIFNHNLGYIPWCLWTSSNENQVVSIRDITTSSITLYGWSPSLGQQTNVVVRCW